MSILLIVIFIVLFIVIIYFQYKKRMGLTWTGTLIDKQTIVNQTANTGNIHTTHRLKFQTENGETSLDVDENFYNQCNVGEKFMKAKGEINPKKIENSIPTSNQF